MNGKKELLLLIVGLVLYIVDIAIDIYVALQYKRAGEYGWFALTVIFIALPLWITNFMALYQMKSRTDIRTDVCFYLMFLGVPILLRFTEEFGHWKRTYHDNPPCGENYKECNCTDCKKHREARSAAKVSAYRLAWIRYVETFTESTPQWILQVHIMLRQWSFPWYTVLSASLSLLSLAWSNTALEKTRVTKDGHDFGWKVTVLHFSSQLLLLTTRLSAFVTFTVAFGPFILIILPFEWSMGCALLTCFLCGHMLCRICRGEARCCEVSLKSMCIKLVLTLLLTFYVSETVLESLGFNFIAVKIFFHLFKWFESTWMMAMGLGAFRLGPQNFVFSVWVPIASSLLVASLVFGLIVLVVRHRIQRRQQSQDNPNTTNAQSNAYYLPEPGRTTSATNRALQV